MSWLICGNANAEISLFPYRSSFYLSRFFEDADTAYRHDGSTRALWVSNTIEEILKEPWTNANTPPDAFLRVIATLMDQGGDALDEESSDRAGALARVNAILASTTLADFFG